MLKVRVVLLLEDNGSIEVKAGYPPEDVLDDADIAAAPASVQGKSELDALIAYLQSLGLARPRGSGVIPKSRFCR